MRRALLGLLILGCADPTRVDVLFTADPALEAIAGGKLRLSAGGAHDAQYALHFAAGFGSQVAYVLYKRA